MASLESLKFFSPSTVREIAEKYETPFYVYDEEALIYAAETAKHFPHAFGLTVRYAMKANSNKNILRLFNKLGLQIDASSGFEVTRAILAGIPAKKILLTAQELPLNLESLIEEGIEFNACSLHQLETYGMLFPHTSLGIRVNPGLGSGSTNRTNVGGPASSFGIWNEDLEKINHICKKYHLKIKRIHTHIGSGSDPEVWQRVAALSLNFVELFPDVTTLNLGGGFKVGRMADEKSTDLEVIGLPVKKAFEDFYKITGRKIDLEIEPGTFLLANTAILVSRIQDVNDTGEKGYKFLKADIGMTDLLRPSIYGAQHPIITIGKEEDTSETENYIVVGHCCESGDIFTPKPGDPEGLQSRELGKASIDDYLVIAGAGAYSASMCTKNYNSFPEIAEIMHHTNGSFSLIRRRQTMEQMIQNELDVI